MKGFNLGKIRNLILILALSIFSAEVGYAWGKHDVDLAWQNWKPQLHVINREPPSYRDVDFKLFWDVWDLLAKDYIDKTKINPQEMAYGAIEGMTRSLGDPYTVFLSPKENAAFKEDLTGSKFEGIGAQLGMKGERIVIIAPLRGSPAEKAGVRAGDFILKVGNEETVGWTLPQAVAKIRGEKGTKVILTLEREKEKKPLEITVVRDTILVKSVEWETKECSAKGGSNDKPASPAGGCQIAYLKLSRFGDDMGEWEKAVSQISGEKSKLEGLVFDLRNNPGGYLSGAVYIASEFLKEGTIVQQENAAGARRPYAVERTGKLTNIPMVVLINKGSASASEIVALALRERGRAKLVGEKSFGKGTIQEAQELTTGNESAGLHITTAKWLSPKGASVEGGIEPDVTIEADEDDQTKDQQLEKAIDILTANSK